MDALYFRNNLNCMPEASFCLNTHEKAFHGLQPGILGLKVFECFEQVTDPLLQSGRRRHL